MSSTMLKRKVVLVTGGTGLVGSALREIISEGYDEYKFIFLGSKDGDLCDIKQAHRIFDCHKPDYVINLAARVGGLYANMRANEEFLSVNNSINENVLALSSKFKIKKCLSCLSTCIFPDKITYPLDETMIHLGPPSDTNWGYSMAKRNVDVLNRKYNRDNPESLFTAMIPTNIYGKYDNFSLDNSHVIAGLIHKAYISAEEAKSKSTDEAFLEVCGSGKPLRQFIYAPDLAKLILWMLENYNDEGPIILSPGEDDEVSIGQVADKICESFNQIYKINMRVRFLPNESEGQFKKTASNKKLRNLNHNFSFTPLEEGIKEVVHWFSSSYPNVRK